WRDLNAGILRLEFDGSSVKLLGAAPADKIARRRLRLLQDNGARRVDAQLVHANNSLFERGKVGGPALVLFSFDRKTPRGALEDDDDDEDPDDRVLPCLAEPGEDGGIEMLPFDVDAFR